MISTLKPPSSTPLADTNPQSPLPIAKLEEYRVSIADLEVNAHVGITEEERSKGQRLRINLSALADPPFPTLDRLDAVVCYAHLRDITLDTVRSERTCLLETLAQRIAERCFADPRLRILNVKLEKLDVFEDAGSVGVEMTFGR